MTLPANVSPAMPGMAMRNWLVRLMLPADMQPFYSPAAAVRHGQALAANRGRRAAPPGLSVDRGVVRRVASDQGQQVFLGIRLADVVVDTQLGPRVAVHLSHVRT